MYDEYVTNQEDLIDRPWLLVGTTLCLGVGVIVGLLATIAMSVTFIIGIPLTAICIGLFVKAVKNIREIIAINKRVNTYNLSTHKPSLTLKGNITYCFLSPFSTSDTVEAISTAMTVVGRVKGKDSGHGIIRTMFRVSRKDNYPVDFYVERNDSECKVRACFTQTANDDWWDLFLHTLFEQNPGVDFGVKMALGDPLVAGVLNLSGDTREVSYSHTSGGTSLGGFLLGGALFGDAGAIVGGLSGKQKTVTDSRKIFSNKLLVRIIYTNGRLWEGTVIKGSPLYNEIMVNMR